MAIAPLLQRFVDDELANSAALAERTLAATVQSLRESADAGGEHGRLLEALRQHAGPYLGAFIESLRTLVQDHLREQHGAAHPAGASFGGGVASLQLMDEARVEVDIQISRAMQQIETVAEWELRELQTFTSTLMGQSHVSADSHPLRPLLYATALWDAAGAVTADPAQRAALMRVSAPALAGLLRLAWAAASTRLESQGVEPGIYRTVVLAPSPPPVADDAAAATLAPRGLAPLLGARADSASAAAGAPAVHAPAMPDPANLDDPHQINDLVSRLFGALLSDRRLASALRPALARLQAPVAALACHDRGVLDGLGHPAWRLIDRLGDAGDGHPNADDPRLLALVAVAETLAADVAAGGADGDAARFDRALERLDVFLAEQLAQQQTQARTTIEMLVRTEQRDLLERQLAPRLAADATRAAASPVVRRFLTGPWARVLAESILRFGRDADVTERRMRVVDDLLWSVNPPDHPQSRRRLVGLLPGLLEQLRDGMAAIGLPAAQQQALLDELMRLHTAALRAPARRPDRAPSSPDEIVRALRDEMLEPLPRPPAQRDAVIDVATLETVPAELVVDSAAGSSTRWLDTLRPGSRQSLFLHGRWTRTQLLWRSARDELLLFVGERPGRTHAITRRALDRLADAGLVRPMPDSSPVQRAIDALTRQAAR